MTGAKSYVCVNVKRSGKYIKEAWVNRGNAGQICDYRGTVTVYDGRGRILYQKRSRNHPGCSYLRASVGGTVKRSFPSGRKVCGSWWQGGSVNGRWERVGTACVKM
ncbi:hypothetical protein IL992_35655 [Microbispora sp. NEAU-D428]|nr:hypothetical protein [Microbispora sitophila]MBE3014471.1 hypothetical protein [Microbispora sitophila]